MGVLWFGLPPRTRSVGFGEHQPLGLQGAEQVPQGAGVICLVFAPVEPPGHVVGVTCRKVL